MVTSGHINGQAICFQKRLDPHSFYLTVCCAKWCVTAPDIIVQDNFLQFTMQNVWLQPWMFLVSKCFFCLQNTKKKQTLIMSYTTYMCVTLVFTEMCLLFCKAVNNKYGFATRITHFLHTDTWNDIYYWQSKRSTAYFGVSVKNCFFIFKTMNKDLTCIFNFIIKNWPRKSRWQSRYKQLPLHIFI